MSRFQPDFSERANLTLFPERMDLPCGYDDMHECLRDIAKVNELTLAYRPTLHWLSYVYSILPRLTQPLHIVDVGCGYGDMLRKIGRWAADKNLPVKLVGVDINVDAVNVARKATHPHEQITFIEGDVYNYKGDYAIDVVISSLMTHHLENHQIVRFIRWMEANTRFGWFINDLERSKFSYDAFRFAARFTDWHRFVKEDGATSILRSFSEDDWRRIARDAGLVPDTYLLSHYWPARLCVARVKSTRPR